jgi:AcrR family transcriptional regulator
MMNTVQIERTSSSGGILGVKERQGREREAVTRSILDAARDLFVAEGYNNVSIRKIAERIEYSPAAIYSYFPSKDDIFFALAEEGFRLLFASKGEKAPPDALEAIRRPFLHIYEFSKTHPEYFALMFLDRSVPRISQNFQRFGFVREGKAEVAAVIQRAIDAGYFPAGTHADGVFRILMTATFGASVRRLCDRLAPHEDGDILARETLDATLAGLRAGSPTTHYPDPCLDPHPER